MKKVFIITILFLMGWGTANAKGMSSAKLTLKTTGLEPMVGQHYEGWNIVDGSALSTGRFSIAKDGNIYQVDQNGKHLFKIGKNEIAEFTVDKEQLKSSLFVLTIEPNGDIDKNPSKVHLFGGSYNNGKANLRIEHNSSLGNDFSMANGSFILAAPTGGEFNKGVWFFNPDQKAESLNLPQLPDGWVYEGWIVNTMSGNKYSTGVFLDTKLADSDNAGPSAGAFKLNFPGFPGQDIVQTSELLDDGTHAIVITVEPYPDYDPNPSSIKILKADVDMFAVGMRSIFLDNISMSAPSGTAQIQIQGHQ